jgi:hypothetical protein
MGFAEVYLPVEANLKHLIPHGYRPIRKGCGLNDDMPASGYLYLAKC